MKIDELRRNYGVGNLKRSDLAASPFDQFYAWFQELQTHELPEWFEKNVMTLSTSAHNEVTSRIVLLKHFDTEGFYFFTNYNSEKSQQIESNPHVSLNFHWPHAERQIRIDGIAEKTGRETSAQYFDSRPVDSRVGAMVSSQSEVIDESLDLEAVRDRTLQSIEAGNTPLVCPDWWGGWKVRPKRFEFWQGRPSRLHDRYRYRLDNKQNWLIERLAP